MRPYTPARTPSPKVPQAVLTPPPPEPVKRKLNPWWVGKWIIRSGTIGGLLGWLIAVADLKLLAFVVAMVAFFALIITAVHCEVVGKSKYKAEE